MKRCTAINPEYGDFQCGLHDGHEGEHTVLQPSDVPWFGLKTGVGRAALTEVTPEGSIEYPGRTELQLCALMAADYAAGVSEASGTFIAASDMRRIAAALAEIGQHPVLRLGERCAELEFALRRILATCNDPVLERICREALGTAHSEETE